MARITHKTIGDITEKERRRLKELTLHSTSGSNQDILPATSSLHEFQVFISRENDEILAWAAVFPLKRSKTWSTRRSSSGGSREDHYSAYFYTSPVYRGKGLGVQLFGRVVKFLKKYNAKSIVFPWDDKSTKFFNKCIKIAGSKEVIELY